MFNLLIVKAIKGRLKKGKTSVLHIKPGYSIRLDELNFFT